MRRVWMSYGMVAIGGILTAVAFGLIVLPQNFAAGGITGLSVLLCRVIPVPVSLMVLMINLALFAMGWFFVGRDFVLKTLLISLLFPASLEMFQQLDILAESEEAGILLVKSKSNREIFMTGHLEYDTETLAQEYFRDVRLGLPIEMPVNYFPDNDSLKAPLSTWRGTAHLFYSNWLNYYVYQETPFNLTDIHWD